MFGVFNLQSAYSMLENTIPLPELIERGHANGYDFIALSDDNLHGMVTFFERTKSLGIKPILGLRFLVSIEDEAIPMIAYVRNAAGYRNLLSIAWEKTRDDALSLDRIDRLQSGLIFMTEGPRTAIDRALERDDTKRAEGLARELASRLDSFYLGLSLDTFTAEMAVAPKMNALAGATGIPLAPLHRTSYIDKNDVEVYRSLIRIASDQNDINDDENYAFMSKKSLMNLFSDYPDVFDQAAAIAKSVTFDWKPPVFEMPAYPTKKGATESDYLRSLAFVGLKKRLKEYRDPDVSAYEARLRFELRTIHDLGYDNYFLIVYDFVRYAKTKGILVGPGRGSAAGSLVAFVLGITDVDPLRYDLLFERFLNPARMSMPDIDLDFPDDRRDEVIEYVKERYGEEHIASIVTFGRFALRSSIRDIARVMRIDQSRVAGIIRSVLDGNTDETDSETMRLLKVAKRIEGLPRHTGTHAAGIILARQNLREHIPMQKGSFSFQQTQLEARDLEAMGLLKIDFLGIRNLTVIDGVIALARKHGIGIDIARIPLDDTKTYRLLAKADTTGIFQLESHGMRSVLRRMQPRHFEDIVALLALYRPGPMDSIATYVKRRGGARFSYLHPALEPILKRTYGIIVYQEQIMQIASQFAGYSLAEADLLRRAISKKDRKVLLEERTRFVQKCREQNYPEKVATAIYDLIVKFADYGFNRSHSVAYSLVAYRMAYLKANYFPFFMTVLLSSVVGNVSLTKELLDESRRSGLEIRPPDIRISTDRYLYDGKAIVLPLSVVRTIHRRAVERITEEREKQAFADYQDFKSRLRDALNEKNLDALIHAGALDGFGLNRRTMSEHKGIESLGFDRYIDDYRMKIYDDYPFKDNAEREKEALGFNIRFDPLRAYADVRKKRRLNRFKDLENNERVEVLAYLKQLKRIRTKNNETMAFALIDDGNSEIEATVFPRVLEEFSDLLTEDVRIYRIKQDSYRDRTTYVVERVDSIE
ncbi:MAG: DNA polymerase III subunit alpha [Acholeplasmataceae bacterium]